MPQLLNAYFIESLAACQSYNCRLLADFRESVFEVHSYESILVRRRYFQWYNKKKGKTSKKGKKERENYLFCTLGKEEEREHYLFYAVRREKEKEEEER